MAYPLPGSKRFKLIESPDIPMKFGAVWLLMARRVSWEGMLRRARLGIGLSEMMA